MSTQQDIYAASFENRPPMLNKDNYVPWSSRLLRYAKSKPNRKLLVNSIKNGPYTDDELTEKEVKQMEADDQAIQTILIGLPEDIYAAVDSCDTAREIWLRVEQMMKGSSIGVREKKAKLFNEWQRFNSTEGESIESYYHSEVDAIRAERLARTHDPLALMANSHNPYNYQVFHPDQPSPLTYMQQSQPNNNYIPQPSFNMNYMQQPMPNPKDISDPTTAMNIALVLMAKAFKLNYSTPTNNNQRTSSNPRNRNMAQLGMNMGQDRQIQMVGGNGGNQFRHSKSSQTKEKGCCLSLDSVIDCSKEEAGIQLQAEEFDLMAAIGDINEIEEVNANCILMANLQQASTSGSQTDKAPVYDSDGTTELLNPITDPHMVQQNNSNVISVESSMEHSEGTVEQHPGTVEEIRAYFESLYNSLAIKVEKVNTVNPKMKEINAHLTTELARYRFQEKSFEINKADFDKLETGYRKSVYQEQCLTKKINALHLSSAKQITALNGAIANLKNQLSKEKSVVSLLEEEKKRLKSDFKTREDELLDKQIQYEKKIKELDNIMVKTG
ncbi:hypothetical protein Tco_0580585 [Tanacetum coccineum]